MTALIDRTEDTDLECMFADARRYPLLTAEEEQEIDGRKWEAVDALQKQCIDAPGFRAYLQTFLRQCLDNPPDIAQFASREQHFILRRELAVYFPGAAQAARVEEALKSLPRQRSLQSRLRTLRSLNLPASLTVGIAVAMLRQAGIRLPDSVADAIGSWEKQWSTPVTTLDVAPTSLTIMREHLTQYSEARDALVMHNLRLVYSIAARYKGRGVPYPDLIQEGTLGLIRAAEKFEYSKGFRFSTYCFNWITQAVRRYAGDTAGTVRLPTHVQEQLGKVYREKALERARTGLDPEDTVVAEKSGLPLARTRELLQLRNLTTSLDAPRFDDEDGALLDTLPADTGVTEKAAEQASLRRFLKRALGKLERAERRVILARWGLEGHSPLSRAEIADGMGVSREWVRQLEQSALKKLRHEGGVARVFDDYRAEWDGAVNY